MRRTYATMDGLRGVAALAVMFFHGAGWVTPLSAPAAYLAVDLFFVLSGFVLAHAYERRFADGMGAIEFMRVRLIRLYPLYLFGFLIAAFSAAVTLLLGAGQLSVRGLVAAVTTGLLILPSPTTADEIPAVFPINSVAWSLFFELVINFLYVSLWRWLTTRVLILILLLAAGGLVFAGLHFGTLDLGSAWPNVWGGLPRVVFAFSAGVLLHRLRPSLKHRPRLAWALVVAILPPMLIENIGLELLAVLVLFPLIVWCAAQVEPGPSGQRIFGWLGVTSYGVYVIHVPIFNLVRRGAQFSGIEIEPLTPWAGLALIAAITAFAWALDRYYDAPVRRWLSTRHKLEIVGPRRARDGGAKARL